MSSPNIRMVVKRDKTLQVFDESKINRWAEYAARFGVDWKDIASKTLARLPMQVSTEEIHKVMIQVCLDKENMDYSRVAARLLYAELRGNMWRVGLTDRMGFSYIYDVFNSLGLWTEFEYKPCMEAQYEELFEQRLEYWQIRQWMDKYSLKISEDAIETPHMAALAIGHSLFDDEDQAFELAKAIIKGQINLPTPALNGIRNGDYDTISCSVIEGGDTIPSIGVAEHLAYRMTAKKAGIGIKYNTRSIGDPVKGGNIQHLGKLPIYATVDKAVKMFTQQCYDDKTEVLTNEGWKLFKDLTGNELAAQVHDDRSLEFVPHTTNVSYDISSDKDMIYLSNRYIDCYVTDNHKMVYRGKKYDNWDETFEGYKEVRADEFELSRTKVLDFGGYKTGSLSSLSYEDKFTIALQADGTIRENKNCEDSYVFLFNKEHKVDYLLEILQGLGLEEKLDKGSKDKGYTLRYRPNGNSVGTIITISKPDLFSEKTLNFVYDRDFNTEWALEFLEEVSKWDAHKTETNFEYYSSNLNNIDAVQFVAACCGKYSKIDIKGDRASYTVRVCDFESVTSEAVNKEVVKDYNGKVYCIEVPTHKLVVRRNGKTLVCGNTRGGSATVTFSVYDPEVMEIIMVKSQRTPENKRIDKLDYSMAYDQEFIDAVIDNTDIQTVSIIGVNGPIYKARDILKAFLTVRKETGRLYCINLTEANNHTPFIDPITQSNLCLEIALPTYPYDGMQDLYGSDSAGEMAFCTLAALNVAKINDEEYEGLAKVAVNTLNVLINRTRMFAESLTNNLRRRRSLGVGITGLAGLLKREGYKYSDADYISKVAERHYYWLLKASQDAVEEFGSVSDIDINWLPIDTRRTSHETHMDWEGLRGKPRANSVLVAHMPTESSAVFSDATNGLYPVRNRVINKQSRKGSVQYIAPDVEELAWDIDNNTLARAYAAVQSFTDQAISADYYVPAGKISMAVMMKEWVTQAKLGVKTMYYLNTNDNNGGMFEQEQGCEGGACRL